jgi:gamma-glutamyltranspeptidase / glutathione hydrolase
MHFQNIVVFLCLSLSLVVAQNVTHGAVATEIAQCSQIGADMLRIGGNAADAMIAGCLCVGTVASYHSSLSVVALAHI